MVRLLMIAPTIDRDDIGEAWVAFQWASRMSSRHETTVLTYRKKGRPSVAAQLPTAEVVEWTETPLVGRAERLNSLMKPAYFPFALRAHRWIASALRRGRTFDVAHQPLPVAMRYPSPLAGLPIPYIIGPVGGSLDSPSTFAGEDTAPWYTQLRRLDRFRLANDPLLRRTYEQADCVLGIAPYVSDHLKHTRVRRIEYLSETGLSELPTPVADLADHTAASTVKLLFVGRVIRTKGVRDLVAAVARVDRVPVHADIVGDGFDLATCRTLALELGVQDRITFHGSLPRPEIDAFYRAADIFVFPSFREPGGNVVFEAMGFGLPLIVCNRGGPGAAVDSTCAIAVPAHDPAQLASAVADAITTLGLDPERRKEMGAAARLRVAQVGLWNSKIDLVSELYAELSRPHPAGSSVLSQ